MQSSPTPSPSAVRPGGLSLSGALLLTSVVTVLLVVSVPRLRGIALQENEVDARATAELLARSLGAASGAEVPRPAELLRRPELAGVCTDAELLANGALLRRHGYLFEVTRLCPSVSIACAPLALPSGAATGLGCLLAVRAWPWKREATGSSAFVVTAAGGTLVHAGLRQPWQGPEAAGLVFEGGPGWTRAH